MSFSQPFPYLRVPLSAIVRKGTVIEEGQPLTVGHVLNWTKRASEGRAKIRILLVRGEVGDEFVTTFLTGINRDDRTQVELAESLDPNDLYTRLADQEGPHLLLADMATCVEVHKRGEKPSGDNILQPLEDDPKNKFKGLVYGHKNFPVLALYPIAFGLPKGDDKWEEMVNGAMDSLMSEGARILFSLYSKYLNNEPNFRDFIMEKDELVNSRLVQDIFQELIEKHRPSEDKEKK